MKAYKMSLENSNDYLISKSPDELFHELESLEIGESAEIKAVDMSNQELSDLGEFEGF